LDKNKYFKENTFSVSKEDNSDSKIHSYSRNQNLGISMDDDQNDSNLDVDSNLKVIKKNIKSPAIYTNYTNQVNDIFEKKNLKIEKNTKNTDEILNSKKYKSYTTNTENFNNNAVSVVEMEDPYFQMDQLNWVGATTELDKLIDADFDYKNNEELFDLEIEKNIAEDDLTNWEEDSPDIFGGPFSGNYFDIHSEDSFLKTEGETDYFLSNQELLFSDEYLLNYDEGINTESDIYAEEYDSAVYDIQNINKLIMLNEKKNKINNSNIFENNNKKQSKQILLQNIENKKFSLRDIFK
jgi:hypothetical protein